jgi:hypothetical protein
MPDKIDDRPKKLTGRPRKGQEKGERVHMGFRCPVAMDAWLRDYADDHRMPVADVVIAAIGDFMKKKDRKK